MEVVAPAAPAAAAPAAAPAADGAAADVVAPAEGAAPASGAAPAAPAVKVEAPAADRETALRTQLHKREQDLTSREGKLKLTEDERTELEALRSLKGRAKEDAIGVLQELGLDAETVFKALQGGKVPMDPVARRALEKAEALDKELKEQRKAT